MDYLDRLNDLQDMQRHELVSFYSKFNDVRTECDMLCIWVDTGRAEWYLSQYNQIFSLMRSEGLNLQDLLDEKRHENPDMNINEIYEEDVSEDLDEYNLDDY